MALIRWQPFSEIETLRRQIDQMFNEISGFNLAQQISWQPAIELQISSSISAVGVGFEHALADSASWQPIQVR